MRTLGAMKLRLAAASVPFWVDVTVRDFGGRWLAVAQLAGEFELGVGTSARAALADAIACLGADAQDALLAAAELPSTISDAATSQSVNDLHDHDSLDPRT